MKSPECVCLDVLIWNASLLREIVLVQLDVFHNYAERKPKSLLWEKTEKNTVCSVLTLTLFCGHLVLCCWLKSALSGVVREQKDVAAMPDPQSVNKR